LLDLFRNTENKGQVHVNNQIQSNSSNSLGFAFEQNSNTELDIEVDWGQSYEIVRVDFRVHSVGGNYHQIDLLKGLHLGYLPQITQQRNAMVANAWELSQIRVFQAPGVVRLMVACITISFLSLLISLYWLYRKWGYFYLGVVLVCVVCTSNDVIYFYVTSAEVLPVLTA
jgi:hypothetical protein